MKLAQQIFIITILSCFCAIGGLKAQEQTGVTKDYEDMEEYPRFPGCDNGATPDARDECAEVKLLQFIYSNLKYPDDAKKDNISGVVIVKFTVDTDGSLKKPKVEKSLGHGCDEELLRVVAMMPKWVPGKNAGSPAKADFILVVRFKP